MPLRKWCPSTPYTVTLCSRACGKSPRSVCCPRSSGAQPPWLPWRRGAASGCTWPADTRSPPRQQDLIPPTRNGFLRSSGHPRISRTMDPGSNRPFPAVLIFKVFKVSRAHRRLQRHLQGASLCMLLLGSPPALPALLCCFAPTPQTQQRRCSLMSGYVPLNYSRQHHRQQYCPLHRRSEQRPLPHDFDRLTSGPTNHLQVYKVFKFLLETSKYEKSFTTRVTPLPWLKNY